MLAENYIAKLLNLEDDDIIVTDAEEISGELHIHLELSRKEHCCPQCGILTSGVNDYREQIIKGIPFGCTTVIHLRKHLTVVRTTEQNTSNFSTLRRRLLKFTENTHKMRDLFTVSGYTIVRNKEEGMKKRPKAPSPERR